jgi:hypothetical protein
MKNNTGTTVNVPAQMEQLLKERIQDYRKSFPAISCRLVLLIALYLPKSANRKKHSQMQAGNSKNGLIENIDHAA